MTTPAERLAMQERADQWHLAVEQNRIGMFVIKSATLQDWPAVVAAALGLVLVYRAEQRYELDGIAYYAISPEFAPLARGRMPPEYMVQVEQEDDVIEELRFVPATVEPKLELDMDEVARTATREYQEQQRGERDTGNSTAGEAPQV